MQALVPLWGLGVLVLAGWAAWNWSQALMLSVVAPALRPYADSPSIALILSVLAIVLPILAIGGSIGRFLAHEPRQQQQTPLPRKVAPLIVFALSGWLAYEASPAAARLAAPYVSDPALQRIAGGLFILSLTFAIGMIFALAVLRDLEGWSVSTWNRRIAGWFWRGLLAFSTIVGTIIIIYHGSKTTGFSDQFAILAYRSFDSWRGFTYLILGLALWACVNRIAKESLGKATKSFRRAWRDRRLGLNHWATYAGLFEEWSQPFRPWLSRGRNRIYFGNSLYDPNWQVGIKDERHLFTIAANAAGKGRTAIIPNLLRWPGSVLVIDPKGTNTIVTAARRGKGGGRVKTGMGQQVYCINPFRVNEGLPGMPRSSRFNPLSIIDLNSATAYQDLNQIVDALVVQQTGEHASFFDNTSRILLRSLMAHAVLKYGRNATLMTVAGMISQVAKGSPLVSEMLDNVTCGGAVSKDISDIVGTEERTLSNIRVTAAQHIDWVADPAMQEALAASDFDIFDLKNRPTSLYLVIPVEYIETNYRFLRLFINLSIKAASRGGKSKTPILFVLDEFHSLGRMPSLTAGAGRLRSFNVKLWPILQNVGQIIDLYPQNWESYIANAGQTQVFGINDQATAEYFSIKCGGVFNAYEIGLAVSRESNRQLIYQAGQQHFVLKRVGYDELFPRSQYNPDPDHKGS